MIEFTIAPDDGDPYEVTATARDVLLWEKTTKGRSFAALMDDVRMTDMYALAHAASRRQRLFTGTLAEFERDCELEFEEAEEPDPTQPDLSDEPASPSRSRPASPRASGPKRANEQS